MEYLQCLDYLKRKEKHRKREKSKQNQEIPSKELVQRKLSYMLRHIQKREKNGRGSHE